MFTKIGQIANDQKKAGYLFILPSVLILFLFVCLPLIFSLISSLFNINASLTSFQFIGLQNYLDIAQDSRFWNSLMNTFYFTVLVVPLQIIISLLCALAIKQHNKYNLFMRSVFFIPVVCSMAVISIVFVFLLDHTLGPITLFLRSLGFNLIDLLNSTTWAMPTVILITVWKNFGFTMVILLAGLQGVPDHYYEAAQIDGASKIQQFFKITLPLIIPTMGFVTITTIISSFQVFDQVFIMTGGGPLYKTETVVQYIYYTGFVSNQLGYATANAFVLFLVILVVTLFMFRGLRKSEANF